MTISIKDVARIAGVAPSTVSRALGKGPVSDAVRERVLAAVRTTGYRPNLAARRLRSRHTGTVGLIVADIRNPFFTAVCRAVEDAAYRKGMRVILCNTDEDPEREAMYLGLMAEERVTGVILAPTRGARVRLETPLGFPVVLLDRAEARGYDTVVLDNARAVADLVDHLVAQGYRRIGGLFGATSATGVERRAAFLAAMSQHGLVADARSALPSVGDGIATIGAWLDETERPEALLVSNGLFLEAAMKAARERRIALPAGLALAGFDDESWTSLVEPGITVIRQPVETMGAEAMSLLAARIARPDAPTRTVVLTGRFIPRGSTAPRE
ncbi:LacI family transcriptional regulator [Rhizobiaceae bacterium BDR2-2]|uniref:LacI family transcriptional regulator n=1 Tax=Ectorhizobium quercum TaxID=2965071 RepID=A0AAE3MYH7_9HYPH|nr:LacI family DNA-binding transcriptional regulator [Ectorhizobium quercum]MCX8997363.1 LacI family transcriptional regulator [Ectorhizobium quercum]